MQEKKRQEQPRQQFKHGIVILCVYPMPLKHRFWKELGLAQYKELHLDECLVCQKTWLGALGINLFPSLYDNSLNYHSVETQKRLKYHQHVQSLATIKSWWILVPVYGQESSKSTTGFIKNQGRGNLVMKTHGGKYFYDR